MHRHRSAPKPPNNTSVIVSIVLMTVLLFAILASGDRCAGTLATLFGPPAQTTIDDVAVIPELPLQPVAQPSWWYRLNFNIWRSWYYLRQHCQHLWDTLPTQPP